MRLEQQYPFPHDDFKAAFAQFPSAKEVVWCQEEPQNQGAWYRLRAYLRADIAGRDGARLRGPARSRRRRRSATRRKHIAQQKQLIEDAFAPDAQVRARW